MTNVLDHPYDNQNVFAAIIAGSAPAHRIFENDTVLAFLDIAPQGPGHTLVIPKSGVTNLFDIAPDDLGSLLEAVQQVGKQLVAALGADGLEVQQLNGAAAGQTVFHLHFHLIRASLASLSSRMPRRRWPIRLSLPPWQQGS